MSNYEKPPKTITSVPVNEADADLCREGVVTHANNHRQALEAYLRSVLAMSYTPEGVDVWMAGSNRRLYGDRPIEMLDWIEQPGVEEQLVMAVLATRGMVAS